MNDKEYKLTKKKTEVKRKNNKDKKGIGDGWVKVNPDEIIKSMLESESKKRERINQERRELRDSLNKELDTGSKCRICGGEIVELRTEIMRPRTGMERIGGCHSAMGIIPEVRYESEYYCRECRVAYVPPLPKPPSKK